ncbi:MAG: Creatininase [Paenibacillaceae bacterium]|jgi:creatinine amidohydrolase|nr:Creatininase [Paenibacillaceae bacterium]
MLTMNNHTREFERLENGIAVWPLGALEQHGSHLPLGTDILIAEQLAKRVAERLDAYLLPVQAITSSIEHREARGTVYIKATTLAAIVRDVAESLHYAGYRKLVIISGHGGNWIVKPTIRQLNRETDGMRIVYFTSTIGARREGETDVEHRQHDLHAGEKETSIMMHLFPDLVADIRAPEQTDPHFPPQDFMDYFDVADLTEDGYWGYPESATPAKGEQLVNILVESILEYLEQVDEQGKQIEERKKSRPHRQEGDDASDER